MIKYSPPRYLFRRHIILRKVKPANNFLEIGAGNLSLSVDLLQRFSKGTSIDFAPKMKDLYEELPRDIQKKLTVIVDDFIKHKFDKKFDCVVSCETMEHVKDDSRFLKRSTELLKSGGQIIFSVPAKQKYWTVHDEMAGHFKRYEKQELISMFEKNGLNNVRVYSYGFPFVNLLWKLREAHGKSQVRRKSDWSKEKRTKASGIRSDNEKFGILGFIANKYVFYIPALISSLFDNFDWSEAYLITAIKK